MLDRASITSSVSGRTCGRSHTSFAAIPQPESAYARSAAALPKLVHQPHPRTFAAARLAIGATDASAVSPRRLGSRCARHFRTRPPQGDPGVPRPRPHSGGGSHRVRPVSRAGPRWLPERLSRLVRSLPSHLQCPTLLRSSCSFAPWFRASRALRFLACSSGCAFRGRPRQAVSTSCRVAWRQPVVPARA